MVNFGFIASAVVTTEELVVSNGLNLAVASNERANLCQPFLPTEELGGVGLGGPWLLGIRTVGEGGVNETQNCAGLHSVEVASDYRSPPNMWTS